MTKLRIYFRHDLFANTFLGAGLGAAKKVRMAPRLMYATPDAALRFLTASAVNRWIASSVFERRRSDALRAESIDEAGSLRAATSKNRKHQLGSNFGSNLPVPSSPISGLNGAESTDF